MKRNRWKRSASLGCGCGVLRDIWLSTEANDLLLEPDVAGLWLKGALKTLIL